jgi:hypothetical protein
VESITQQVIAALRRGQLEQLLPALETLMATVKPGVGLETEIWGYGGIALAQLAQGNYGAAHLAAERALNIMKRARPASFWTLDSCAGVVKTYLQ